MGMCRRITAVRLLCDADTVGESGTGTTPLCGDAARVLGPLVYVPESQGNYCAPTATASLLLTTTGSCCGSLAPPSQRPGPPPKQYARRE